jgi:predicted HD phosphohydrolase
MADTVKFTAMKDGDRDDYEFLTAHEIDYAAKTGERLLDALVQLDEGLSGYKITRLGHSLQAATRAWRDGADTDWIACALLHDIGDIYAPYNHDEYAASILKPFVREQCTWVVEKHGDFQRLYYAHHLGGNRHARDRFAGICISTIATSSANAGTSRASTPTMTRCRSSSSGPSCSKSSPARPTTPP